MALTKEEAKIAYPLPVYNYRVDVGGVPVAFSEVSGLTVSYEKTTYKESNIEGGNPYPKKMIMPAQIIEPTISLKKGLVSKVSMPALYGWLKTVQINQIEKKDILISLCDEGGKPVISWKAINAFPTKLDAPTFDASSNDASIESMELIADQIIISETDG